MRFRSLAQAAGFAVVDQGVTSAANFVANALLIHYAAKESYGVYVVAFSTLLLIGSTVDVVFSLQMTYLAPHHPESTRKAFCAGLRTAQTCVSLALGFVVCAASGAGAALGLLSPDVARFGAIIGIGSLCISYLEFYRSLLYLFDAASRVLLLTGLQILVWAAAILLNHVAHLLPLNEAVLAGYCIGAGAGALLGRTLVRLPKPESWGAVRGAASEAWEQGIWSLLGSVISWVQNQSYAWLLAVLASAAVTAEASFAKLFFAPLGLMLVAVGRVARPGLGKVYAEAGDRVAVRQGRRLLIGMILLVALYCPAIWLSKDWIIAKTGSGHYSNAAALTIAWGIVTAFQVTRWNSTLLLGVLRRNREMSTVQAIAAAIAVAASVACIPTLHAMGAILSVGLGELILTLLMWREVNRALTGRARLLPSWRDDPPRATGESSDMAVLP